DAGSNTLAAGLAFDERGPGFPRIINNIVDIGAYEYHPPATTTTIVSSLNPSQVGQNVTFTATVGGPDIVAPAPVQSPNSFIIDVLAFAAGTRGWGDLYPSLQSLREVLDRFYGSLPAIAAGAQASWDWLTVTGQEVASNVQAAVGSALRVLALDDFTLPDMHLREIATSICNSTLSAEKATWNKYGLPVVASNDFAPIDVGVQRWLSGLAGTAEAAGRHL